MKHIGLCLDKIQMEFMYMPSDLNSEAKKKTAKKIIDNVQKYATTLERLILYPKFKEYLSQLEDSSIEGIKLQAHDIKELLKDLEHALQTINLTLEELREVLGGFYEKEDQIRWKRSYDKLVVMIDQKFGGERGELRKEFQVALHKKEDLKKLELIEEHLAELLQ